MEAWSNTVVEDFKMLEKLSEGNGRKILGVTKQALPYARRMSV